MKRYWLLMLMLFVLLMGCSEKASSKEETKQPINETSKTEKKEEKTKDMSFKEKQLYIIQFINKDIEEVSVHEVEAKQALATVSGKNYKSDEEMYGVLTSQVIPVYEKARDTAEKLDPKLEELEPLTDRVKEATSIYYEALLIQKEALEKQDKNLIDQANAKVMEYSAIINQHHAEMEKLAKTYKVDYKPHPGIQ
ncbi:hypothetical protein ACFFJY_00640 [Fictibacillus aquaticus]|uniref:Lipoprotein n=1 Tax=Fictibacillus aquaticus TaxID=2021314 RepID=A0A235F866_9BACL|nr:hypothetical protein [Fictibacillus aquaticus]OYD57233.1 hypothetical protein CGZ90_11120 [Fictibacillus aquaticus]